MKSSAWVKQTLALAVIVLIGGGAAFARQQAGAAEPVGSLAELTAEVRLLRLSVEKSAEANAQIQAMTVYLSAQQSRLVQVSARADALGKDLDAATRESGHLADAIAESEKALSTPASDAVHRRQVEAELSHLKRALARATAVEAEIKKRESDATAAVHGELARWTEMIARLDQATRR